MTKYQFGLFFAPSLSVIIYSLIRIGFLARKLSVAPAAVSDAEARIRQKKKASINKAIRLVLLVSGAYWGTYFPGYCVMLGIEAFYNVQELNSRNSMVASILYRTSSFFLAHFSSFLNPIVYFATHKDLLTGAQIVLGMKKNFPAHDDDSTIAENNDTVNEEN